MIRPDEHDVALAVGEACHEYFREKRPDLLFGEVTDCDDLSADQFFFRVERRHLCTRSFRSKIAEVECELVSWLSRLRKILYGDDSADTKLNFFEILPGYLFHKVMAGLFFYKDDSGLLESGKCIHKALKQRLLGFSVNVFESRFDKVTHWQFR